MNSKQRVRAVMQHQVPDRVPAAFECVGSVMTRLLKHYGYTDAQQLWQRYQIDIVTAGPKYIGPELKTYLNEKGETVISGYWGNQWTRHTTAIDTYQTNSYFPMDHVESVADVDACTFPDPDWFDYSAIAQQCDRFPDKAIIIGHEGPFQIVTNLMRMENFFVLMVEEPDAAKRLLQRMNEFEMEFYKRCFEAGGGRVDILRPHDDYGTQISMLFSVDMWKEFFMENTRKLVDLAHSYGAFYQQHSCGAVAPLIPLFIECGVDALEPIQKVKGLEVETLAERYGGQIVFHGGIDTQGLLPFGSAEEVKAETEKFIRLLSPGYILMASQGFEGDVPFENIEAVYQADRTIRL